MTEHSHSDALVFFGATGDLAYKKIFPSLQAMVKRGHLDVPVIGVAKAGWNLDQLRARAYDSLEKHGGIDRRRFRQVERPAAICRRRLRGPLDFERSAGNSVAPQRPAHYLAIPPVLFGPVVEQLEESGCCRRRPRHHRETVRQRPGVRAGSQHDSCSHASTKRRYSGSTITLARGRSTTCDLPLRERFHGAVLESQLSSRACRSPWRRTSAFRDAAAFTMRPAPSAT